MSKYRIVQRDSIFFIQKKFAFFWFFETSFNFAHSRYNCKTDENGFIGFISLEDAKEYLHTVINFKTKIVYEVTA